MTLEEFKECVELNKNVPKWVVCICEDETSEFVFHQYVHKYITDNNLTISYINDIAQVTQTSLFTVPVSSLFIYDVKELVMSQIPTSSVWIKCKKISYKSCVIDESNIVTIPKLEDWQVKDYVYSMCEGLSEKELSYLVTIHGKNLFRLENELSKILVFDDIVKIYPQIKSQLFTDTSEYGIFDVINAIVRYDKVKLTKLLLDVNNIDIDVFGCLKLLLNNFYKIINVQLSKSPNAKELGMSDKQLWAIKKYSCGIYTKTQLIEIYKLLTKCDWYIKSGYIPVMYMLDYIIINIMSIKERII